MFDLVSGGQYVVALVFVLGLIGVMALIARRFGLVPAGSPARGRRLSISEVLTLDGRRRLLLVRCDGAEHLVLLGINGETVIDRRSEDRYAASPSAMPSAADATRLDPEVLQ